MQFIEKISSLLGTLVTPLMLLLSACILLPSIGVKKILNPKLFLRTLSEKNKTSSTTPMHALFLALAGTLGVGNITGVASALIAGGPGAIFWMWIGALAVLAVKYAEVYLAVRYRKKEGNGWIGGAMYYICDGLKNHLSARHRKILAGFFASLCCLNSLITGNIVQANAVSSVIPRIHPLAIGCILAFCVLLAILHGTRRVEKITSRLIPPLSLLYIILTMVILCLNRNLLPDVLHDILSSAFTMRAAAGGATGFTICEAMRFGVMRGIFSNEAGCGTSPTAHASADTISPHHQACLGIVEVIFDTLLLCTLTAFVLLIADRRFSCLPWHEDVSPTTIVLESFQQLTNGWVHCLLVVSIILFAYATILAQLYYGSVAIGYLSRKKELQTLYSALSVIAVIGGSVISAPIVWLAADIILGMMTAVNCMVIILLRKECLDPTLR